MEQNEIMKKTALITAQEFVIWDSSLFQHIQRGSEIHPVSYSMDTRALSCS